MINTDIYPQHQFTINHSKRSQDFLRGTHFVVFLTANFQEAWGSLWEALKHGWGMGWTLWV